jgi:hypothetical protein
MIPPEKSHVKILLKNNATVEGIVQEWGINIKLRSLDDQSYMIIPHPESDIVLIKVFHSDTFEEKEKIETASEDEVKTKLERQFQQVIEQPSDDPTRHKSLAELKVLLANQDRQLIADKLRSHHLRETKKVEYGYPGFLSEPRTK